MFSRESNETPREHIELHKGISSVGSLFGLTGIEISIASGNIWATEKTPNGVKITVNPNGIKDTIPLTEGEALYATAHEVGHAIDMLDKNYGKPKKESDRFFWNVLDDTVINSRLDVMPRLEQTRQKLYDKLFPTIEQADQPKHIQLMYGILLNKMAPDTSYVFDPEVVTAIESLEQYHTPSGQTADIIQALCVRRTTLAERRLLGNLYVKPIYEKFLKEDTQQQESQQNGEPKEQDSQGQAHSQDPQSQDQSQSDKANDASKPFKDQYDAYEEKTHGGNSHDKEKDDTQPQENKESSEENDTPDKTDSSEVSKGEASANKEGREPSEPINGFEIADALREIIAEIEANGELPSEPSLNKNDSDISNEEKLAGYLRAEMNLDKKSAEAYIESLKKYRGEINAIADLFLLLAAKAEVAQAPRFDTRADQDGKRLHPLKLSRAALQTVTRGNYPIWQPITRRGNKEALEFGGLDISLIVDVSQSMQGSSAKAAASTAQILLEGLELAKERASASQGTFITPDVRTQVIAFGSSSKVLAPLSIKTEMSDKGTTYEHLLNPNSGSTYVADALEKVLESTKENPTRDQLVIIVTDGAFSDAYIAQSIVDKMGDNVFVIQINIQNQAWAITPNEITIDEATELPLKLYPIIRQYVESII